MSQSNSISDGLETLQKEIENLIQAKFRVGHSSSSLEDLENRAQEFKKLIQESATLEKEESKVSDEMKTVTERIGKAKAALALCSENNTKMEQKIAKKKLEVEEKKNKEGAATYAWQMLGLNVVQLDSVKKPNGINGDASNDEKTKYDGNYAIEFTKVDPQNFAKKFVVKVSLSGSSVKIYETSPKNLMNASDVDRIEQRVAEEENGNDGIDFRLLVILLRQHVASKCIRK